MSSITENYNNKVTAADAAKAEETYNPDTERSRIQKMRENQAGLNTPEKISKLEKEPAYLRRGCLLYTSPSPRDATLSRMPSSA